MRHEPHHIPEKHIIVSRLVGEGSTVLDLGCGMGEMMRYLESEKQAVCTGVDKDPRMVAACIRKRLRALNLDFNVSLREFPGSSFDQVIISDSLQESYFTETVLDEALRIGRSVILGFPNFAYFRGRMQLFFKGTAPVTGPLPGEWFNTRNLRFITVNDFRRYCRLKGIHIREERFHPSTLLSGVLPGLFAGNAVFRLTKERGNEMPEETARMTGDAKVK